MWKMLNASPSVLLWEYRIKLEALDNPLSCIHFQLGYSAGVMQALWRVVLALFGAMEWPLAPVYWYMFWQINSKWADMRYMPGTRQTAALGYLIYDLPWASCQIRKIAGAHALGMPGTFSPSPQVSDPYMHHGTCVTHVPWCMPGSLTNGFLWNRRWGETSPAFPAHAQPARLRIW